MAKRIAFIGAAGSGKSTLATEVFVELKKRNKNAEIINEWVRYDIQANGPMQSIWEQYRTLNHQRDLEKAVPESVDYVVVDSGVLTPYFYAALYVDGNDPRQRLVLQDMHKYLINDMYLRWYDVVFYLPLKYTKEATDKLLKDGTRYQTDDELNILDSHMNLMFNQLNKIDNIYTIDGPLDQRINAVLRVLGVD